MLNHFFLDRSIFDAVPPKARKFYNVFISGFALAFFVYSIYIVFNKGDWDRVVFLIYAVILVVLILFHFLVLQRLGRKFVEFKPDSLILKSQYREKQLCIFWSDIESITFIENSFVVKITKPIEKEILFKSPLEHYLDIRNLFSRYAGDKILH